MALRACCCCQREDGLKLKCSENNFSQLSKCKYQRRHFQCGHDRFIDTALDKNIPQTKFKSFDFLCNNQVLPSKDTGSCILGILLFVCFVSVG